MGEALNQAVRSNPALPSSIPEAHGYDEIKDEVVGDAARNGVPELLRQIDQVLQMDSGVVG